MHKGFAMIDIISPCVTFNDHVGSRELHVHARALPRGRARRLHSAAAGDQGLLRCWRDAARQMHDGSQIVLRKLDKDYDPTHRGKAFEYLRTKLRQGEHVTGLIFVSSSGPDMHDMAGTTDVR